jgi:hypothetical protein
LICHLDEIEVDGSGHVQRLGERLDADLLPVFSDESDFAGPDPIVDPGFIGWRCYRRSLLVSTEPPLVGGLPALPEQLSLFPNGDAGAEKPTPATHTR